MANKPRIRLFTLGGTIAMAPAKDGGVVPALTGEALIAAVPDLDDAADIAVENVARLGSGNLGFSHATDLAHRISAAADAGTDGVVVTQGTDTLEEMAFLLALMSRRDVPVIVTGAMRHPGLPSSDGPANLLAAVRAAATPALADAGVVVTMNDELHAARFVSKVHTASTAAFASPGFGPVGLVSEGRVRLAAMPAPVPHLEPPDEPVPAVALVPALFGDIGSALDTLPAGIGGLVVEAFGGGHLPEAMADKAAALAVRMPVILASRTGAGAVLEATYGYRGAEIDLIARGLIPAGLFDARKARLLLALLLAHGSGRDAIAAAFQR